ncbi:hypothetical protein SK128_022792 [Halocaridina rubra]|uniref:Uncharacterized protein n=1 Tax=Halocaridina rubra TaxID=373956 RepID=A0AAN8XHA7_HALRR
MENRIYYVIGGEGEDQQESSDLWSTTSKVRDLSRNSNKNPDVFTVTLFKLESIASNRPQDREAANDMIWGYVM